jgi:putative endopeptidase
MRRSFLILSLLASAAVTSVSHADEAPAKPAAKAAPEAAATKPQIGAFGLDETGFDRTIKPGDDFAAFAGGD